MKCIKWTYNEKVISVHPHFISETFQWAFKIFKKPIYLYNMYKVYLIIKLQYMNKASVLQITDKFNETVKVIVKGIKKSNSKSKVVPLCSIEALLGERRYSSYSLTSTLDGGEWSASQPGRALPPEKEPPVPVV
jgi:hypothetical protein